MSERWCMVSSVDVSRDDVRPETPQTDVSEVSVIQFVSERAKTYGFTVMNTQTAPSRAACMPSAQQPEPPRRSGRRRGRPTRASRNTGTPTPHSNTLLTP